MPASLALITGLIIALFVTGHFINLALGLVSLDAMEQTRNILWAIWDNPVANILLYGSFALHIFASLHRLYQRSHLRMTRWQWAQFLFGMSVPAILVYHIVATRAFYEISGIMPTYAAIMGGMVEAGFGLQFRQSFLLFAVWVHLLLGLHFWLRLKPWYGKNLPWLYPVAILLPVLSLAGYWRGMADVAEQAGSAMPPVTINALYFSLPASQRMQVDMAAPLVFTILLVSIAAVLVARILRHRYRSRHGQYRLTLPNGQELQGPVGQTVLETLRLAAVPHASVCGGKGRCTTCRIRVGDGAGELPAPEGLEADALQRVGATGTVRLACQLAPRRDLSIVPLLPADISAAAASRPGGVDGQEQHVTAMFVDLRGSTTLCEAKLPYDVVFILNLFFAEMADALKDTGGHYAQFAGDGLMALYGIDSSPEEGCRAALRGAADMQRRLNHLNRLLQAELDAPLRMGIGIHTGEAIVGTMGPPATPLLSAIGDNINIAARLEAQCKTFHVPLIISGDVARLAGLDTGNLQQENVAVRGRNGAPLNVYLAKNPLGITDMPGTDLT